MRSAALKDWERCCAHTNSVKKYMWFAEFIEENLKQKYQSHDANLVSILSIFGSIWQPLVLAEVHWDAGWIFPFTGAADTHAPATDWQSAPADKFWPSVYLLSNDFVSQTWYMALALSPSSVTTFVFVLSSGDLTFLPSTSSVHQHIQAPLPATQLSAALPYAHPSPYSQC